jgi:CRISPR-associated protein Cmr2
VRFASEYSVEDLEIKLDDAIYEQAAQAWQQQPAPREAIESWVIAFCDRREVFKGNEIAKTRFRALLVAFLVTLWTNTDEKDRDLEVEKWLKLAAFTLRYRNIKLGGN